ncbi:nitric oxide reductase transcriptional regulator NorR [Aquincola sp. J276]|uniref:nitric oxide reductase transcriptional regulator NorR n=1 Tax=Aquincola sp. J276 TaxID=2898432 RepID=UPI002150B472|nr:nitric oxide reductase transcriptional regulator NorR [Aquincola sp. J276]MCR5864051.1 nitric oxide reductase transcriptional regulator NorR [Aquincola sp. J276]
MTPTQLLDAIVPLVTDLTADLPEDERFRRLLTGLRSVMPCDAAALLRLEGDQLRPMAVDGLSTDTLGRRFRVADHPRLRALLEAPGPVRFAADCGLPDPYDGLVEGVAGHLPVHDCLGCALHLADGSGRPWGLLTLDALQPQRFSKVDLKVLSTLASLAAATVAAGERIGQLTTCMERYRLAAQPASSRLIGQSAAHRALLKEITLVGGSDLCVLIQGETGVGKELVAQALHAASPRADQPMVSINCAALPDTLVESELFGHVKGAFTGATADRAGKFELAHGGTLFLDEVGELSRQVQAKLLRVLQSGQLQRLGSDRERHVDVRVIAASNRNLAQEVKAGRMRADFYHRLSVYPLQVPPLRERGRDVLQLCGHFLEQNRARLGLGGLRLEASAQAALLAHHWPGNVRELEHLVGRSVLRALGRAHAASGAVPRILSLSAADLELPATVPAGMPAAREEVGVAHLESTTPLREAVDAYQRQLIGQALQRHGHRWAPAARELGLDRGNLARLARRLGVDSGTPATHGRRGQHQPTSG